jgi:uncharacterized protein
MKRCLFFSVFILISWALTAQENGDTVPEGYRSFFYPNGKISSEGVMIQGKPDGYWKNYFENGKLKSEGNRVNFELDGPWKFYDDEGVLKLVINYKNGLKNGYRISYTPDERIEENFEDDIKQGTTYYFDKDGFLVRAVPYENGRENGFAKTFNRDSVVIVLMEYRRGVAISREFINRYDNQNRPHGPWKTFYSDGTRRAEFGYKHGVLDGYYRKYDRDGNLESIVKYVDGELIADSDEVFEYEIRRDYYPDMRVKIMGTYRDGVADGIRKEFNPDGSLKMAYVIDMGRLMGSGIIDEGGRKQGPWKEYYREGGLRAEGSYRDGIRIGSWKFYFPDGSIEQLGNFTDRGKEHGTWTWYYPDSTLRRVESYTNGLKNGEMVEYNEQGVPIAKGTYVDDEENRFWSYQEDGYRQEGLYVMGERDGEWKHFYPDGFLSFKGKFLDGYPDGKHIYFNSDGSLKMEGNYFVGVRHGLWKFYSENGDLLILIEYRNGVELKYDNQLIKPEIRQSDL